jgi:benzil reductase ((S)-benzoin forming)
MPCRCVCRSFPQLAKLAGSRAARPSYLGGVATITAPVCGTTSAPGATIPEVRIASVHWVRSVIITGVSRGLGSAFFDEFLAAGDRILALGRRFTEAQHAAERRQPQRVRLRPVDFAYPATLPAAAELASFLHDATDVVIVHNAAVLDPVGAIGTLTADEVHAAVAVNLTAPMVLTNAVMAATRGQREIAVLFISSGAARRQAAGMAVYSATKLAGESFFEALAAQHTADPRIRVVNVNPGKLNTDMQVRIREHAQGDVYFPDRDRYVHAYQRGELAEPVAAAKRIIAEHLRSTSF